MSINELALRDQLTTQKAFAISEQTMMISQKMLPALNAVVISHIEVARICYELEMSVGKNNFNLVVSQLFPEVNTNYLRNHLLLYKKIKQHRQVTEWAGQNFNKALALVQAIDEEVLAAIDKGIAKVTLDEVDKLSVKQLKQRLRKLEQEKEKIIAEETKALAAERDALVKKVNAAQTPPAAITAQMQQLNVAVQQLKKAVLATADIMADDKVGTAQLAGPEVEAAISSIKNQIDILWQLWVERTNHA